MKKITLSSFVIILISSLILTLGACTSKDNNKLELNTPHSGMIFNTNEINISGKLTNKTVDYFFYQIDDGHSYIGDGKIVPEGDGGFDVNIETRTPSNAYVTINFYLDEDNNGVFEPETDTEQLLGSVEIIFNESAIVR